MPPAARDLQDKILDEDLGHRIATQQLLRDIDDRLPKLPNEGEIRDRVKDEEELLRLYSEVLLLSLTIR